MELYFTINAKIKCGPIVDILGDEMARIIWTEIKNKLLLPFLDMELHVFDLGIESRDMTEDRITVECAHAVKQYNVAVKCATIAPDETRVKELRLKQIWDSPNDTICKILRGTVFRESIICKNIPHAISRWRKPIVIARHCYGDEYMATESIVNTPGKMYLVYKPAGGDTPDEILIHRFRKPGVALAMFNTDEYITEFAHTCFKYALHRKMPIYLTTKYTVLKNYDGRFKDIFNNVFKLNYRKAFKDAEIPAYEDKLIGDMIVFCMKSEGGFIWACKNYDGDVESKAIAECYGSIGLTVSVMLCRDGKTLLAEAAHGTVRKHYQLYKADKETSTNPLAMIFAWIRALLQRAHLDRNIALRRFAHILESVCLETLEHGYMTKDLAIRVKGAANVQRSDYMETFDFINKIAENLANKLEI